MKKIISIVLISAFILSFSVLFSSCTAQESNTLYVYNWGEYISDGFDGTLDVNKAFEEYYFKKYNKRIKINYSTFSSNESMYAKIESGAAAYDVIIPSDYMIQRMVKEEMLLPLDIEKIPNYANVDDKFKGDNVYYEEERTPDKEDIIYSVPYFYGMIGIIYNTEMVDEADAEKQSWDLMFPKDEDMKKKYAKNILQFNNSRDAFGTALYKLGYDVNEATPEQWEEARDLLIEQKGVIQGYVMDEIFNKMSSGSAAIAAYYAGDFFTMYDDNDSLAFYYPKEGTNSYIDAMCIPHNSKNPDIAHEYINFMCDTEIGMENALYTYYASPLKTVVEHEDYIDEENGIGAEAWEILYGETASTVKTQAYLNLDEDSLIRLNNLWEELKGKNNLGPGIYICCGVILATVAVTFTVSAIKKRKRAKYYVEPQK